jgi:hypothetical protein
VESLIYPAFLNAKAPLDERGFLFFTLLPLGEGLGMRGGLTANGDALHVLHVTAQYLTDLLASGMVAGHT